MLCACAGVRCAGGLGGDGSISVRRRQGRGRRGTRGLVAFRQGVSVEGWCGMRTFRLLRKERAGRFVLEVMILGVEFLV